MASLEEPAWGLILLYGAQRRFCRAKTLLCGWRAHFCRFNADLPLHLNHGVASPFPPRVKVGSETLMESLSTGAGSQSPRGACFVPLPSRLFLWTSELLECTFHRTRPRKWTQHGPVLGRPAFLLRRRRLPQVLNSSILISTSLFYLLWLAVATVISVTVIRSPFMESGYFKCLFKEYCCRLVILQLDVLVQLY